MDARREAYFERVLPLRENMGVPSVRKPETSSVMFGISGRAKESRVALGAERGIPNAVGRCGVAEAT